MASDKKICQNTHFIISFSKMMPPLVFRTLNYDFVENKELEIPQEAEKKRIPRCEIYGKGSEARLIKEQLNGFEARTSEAYKIIVRLFGGSVRITELLGVLNSIRFLLTSRGQVLPPISRNERRSFSLLIKYVQTHLEQLKPLLECTTLCDTHFNDIHAYADIN
ncbi:hypothetical protein TRFO_23639 [Tritrichomonas foetus]|uniref:Uncharacterized protein n=1 Tax=Tritrichomonas foetus TaxID=1144522 RepID=A0A1J4K9C3_9EUKA|nr:hypothetical protein TRFO_23639 [Tritrichomonas foetus]|eukprot:OHT08015.1 hypothetical protein TRFO_23639 [Tritrichomonas foetus]